MTKLILSAIIIIGTAFVLIFKRWGTKDARREKLQKELDDVVEEMEKITKYDSDFDPAHYHRLYTRRLRLNKKLNRISR